MDSDEDMLDSGSVDEDFYSGVDSDADVDDDYAFGGNNSDDSDDLVSTRNQPNFSVLSEADIKDRQEDVRRVSAVLSIPSVEANILLRNYNWSVSKAHDEWDPSKVEPASSVFCWVSLDADKVINVTPRYARLKVGNGSAKGQFIGWQRLAKMESLLYTLADAAVAVDPAAENAATGIVQKAGGWFGFIAEAMEVVLKVGGGSLHLNDRSKRRNSQQTSFFMMLMIVFFSFPDL